MRRPSNGRKIQQQQSIVYVIISQAPLTQIVCIKSQIGQTWFTPLADMPETRTLRENEFVNEFVRRNLVYILQLQGISFLWREGKGELSMLIQFFAFAVVNQNSESHKESDLQSTLVI